MRFFRTRDEGDHSGLTLPRAYFGRSDINNASLFNTDLHESNLCWNDFTDVDFGESDLSQSDLRASVFEMCLSPNAILKAPICGDRTSSIANSMERPCRARSCRSGWARL